MGEFLYFIGEDQTYSYVKYMLANSCMPTLLGIKPSCLITVNKKYIESKESFLSFLLLEISQFECNYTLIYEEANTYSLFLYNPKAMEKTLAVEENQSLLKNYGYEFETDCLTDTINKLSKHYAAYKNMLQDFPHELGILLGYPINDVIDYIKNDGKNFKSCGYWKVYNDVEHAEKMFAFFRLVRDDAMRILSAKKNLLEMKTSCGYIKEYAMVG